MDDKTRRLIEGAYDETVDEALARGLSKLEAHKEGVVAAGMLLASTSGIEDAAARERVIALNLRPGD